MKFSFIFATFALPLVANAASPPPSSSEGTTNEDFNSKANNADWTTGYKQVIADIALHGFDDALEGLPQLFSLAVPTVMPNGKIRMEYNFNTGDNAFSSLLSSKTVGDPKYMLQLIKGQTDLPKTITIPPSTVNYTKDALPWVCVAGKRLEYLQARADQWDVSLSPLDNSPLNPWRRNAAIVGMDYDTEQGQGSGGGYANNYIVTFDVDPKYVLRPNYHQLPWIAEAKSASMIYENSTYYVDPSWSQLFVNFNSALSAIPTIYDDSGLIDATQSNLVRSQWNTHLLEYADFPFTGIGYTYDWYYQNRTEWSEHKGVGLAEFIVMPSTDDYEVVVDIISVKTTAQLLGAHHAFPGVLGNSAPKTNGQQLLRGATSVM